MSDQTPSVKPQDLEDRLNDVLTKVDANIRKQHLISRQTRRGGLAEEDKPRKYQMLMALLEDDEEDE